MQLIMWAQPWYTTNFVPLSVYTILLVNIAILACFVTLAFFFFACFMLYIINDWITLIEYS